MTPPHGFPRGGVAYELTILLLYARCGEVIKHLWYEITQPAHLRYEITQPAFFISSLP
jgi:hypothetical protein